jgi:hypothetical protein
MCRHAAGLLGVTLSAEHCGQCNGNAKGGFGKSLILFGCSVEKRREQVDSARIRSLRPMTRTVWKSGRAAAEQVFRETFRSLETTTRKAGAEMLEVDYVQ